MSAYIAVMFGTPDECLTMVNTKRIQATVHEYSKKANTTRITLYVQSEIYLRLWNDGKAVGSPPYAPGTLLHYHEVNVSMNYPLQEWKDMVDANKSTMQELSRAFLLLRNKCNNSDQWDFTIQAMTYLRSSPNYIVDPVSMFQGARKETLDYITEMEDALMAEDPHRNASSCDFCHTGMCDDHLDICLYARVYEKRGIKWKQEDTGY